MNRWIVAFIVVVVVILLVACVGYMSGRWEAESAECFEISDEKREELKVILRRAMDDALEHHVERMYEVWMKDDTRQPERARTGTRQGVRAWLRARESLDNFTPNSC
jgi:hypothetical protein